MNRILLALFASYLPAQLASADTREFPAANQKWKAECGGCHVAYPPKMLSAPAWRRLIAGLDRHFGADASIDTRSAAEIEAFLQANAGPYKQGDADALRITETAWFRQQHADLVPTVWTHRLVKTPVNCGACHAAADRGDFSQHRTWFRTRGSRSYADAGLSYTGF
jgi:hypothetical protein